MSQARIWTGSADFSSGSSTPFGTYDSDSSFSSDAPKIASWCAKRLGYPIIDIELQGENFFAVFEESVSEYSSQVNQFNIRNNIGSLEGQPTGANYTGQSVQGSELMNVVSISEAYGNQANVGGRADIKTGSIDAKKGVQDYDLQALWGDVSESGERIDVTKVFHEASPAIQRFFDPYSVSGQGTLNLVDEFGFGSFSKVSKPTKETLPESKAEINSFSLITPPRAALIIPTPSFIFLNSLLSIIYFFCAGTCKVIKSEFSNRWSSLEILTSILTDLFCVKLKLISAFFKNLS